MANLDLPGLSAKDLMVALASQGIHTPLLVIAGKGQEQDIIQAFRLGAADYLLWPAREAEVLSAVERVLARVHEVHDRQRADLKLSKVSHELQHKLQELATLMNVGKAVASTTDYRLLFQKIVDSAAQISESKIAWLLVRDDQLKSFRLTAQRGLPEAWARKTNRTLNDGISEWVARSGETLSISGEPLSKLRIANLGRSACVVPVKVQQEVIGMLVVVRQEARPFEKSEQRLLEAFADYACIALVQARLFRALNHSAQAVTPGEKRQAARLESIRTSINEELPAAIHPIDLLLEEKNGGVSELQRQALQTSRAALLRLARAAEKTTPPLHATLKRK
jgi:GAF domain-containing protein/CheY-like chemotaxis protein